MANLTYEEMNQKYRLDIRRNFQYLVGEIPLGSILPHLHEVLHNADYDSLCKRKDLKSDWDCNQELLNCLVKREYWWRDFRLALVNIERNDIIERLGWDEETFAFGTNRPVVQNPPERNKKSTKEQILEKFTQQKLDENKTQHELAQPKHEKSGIPVLEEITQQKLDVYKTQHEMAQPRHENKVSPDSREPTTTKGNNQPDHRNVDPNLLSENFDEKKHSTDTKMGEEAEENDLGKVLKTPIHPAVRRNLPLNFTSNSDPVERLSNYDASARPCSNPEPSSRDEVNDNLNPASNSPQGNEKISNVQTSLSSSHPTKLDHSFSYPVTCTEPRTAVFPPNDLPGNRTETQEQSTSAGFHHSRSAPVLSRAPFHDRQQLTSVNASQQLASSIKEDGEYFESADQSTMIKPAASDPCLNLDPSNGCSNAERPEIVIQEENSKMCKMENNDTLKSMSSRSQNLATAIPEVPAENPACQSTTDVIQPSIASTVDPTGISRNNNMPGERIIRHVSSNLNREPDSYVTHLHSTGSDVTSSIRSGFQSSNLSQEFLDPDQTKVKNSDSVTLVNAFDNLNLDPASIQSDYSNNSSSRTPDAMRLDAPSAVGDVTTAPPVVENLNLSNSGLAQNPSSAQNPASTQNPEDTMPKFDSLLSGSQSSLPNQNLALTDLPFVQNSNIPEFSELLSEGSSVDPVDNSEPGAALVSVAYPPSTGQLAGIQRESLNQSQEQEGAANSSRHDTAHNEAPPSFFRKLSNSVFGVFDSISEKLVPSAECSE